MIRTRATHQMFCSALALATALVAGAAPAAAQALQGIVNSAAGVGVITTAPGTTTVTIAAPQAVINWTATGPSNGTTTTFSGAGSQTTFTGQADFAILNRVAPGVAGNSIALNGDISSLVNGKVGGTVYFYSPNGIVVGGNARIDVGSFGLTTLPIGDVGGVWMDGFGGIAPQVTFGSAGNPASFVRVDGGSGALRSTGAGNYVALVAPRIEHRGTIRTDSGAALVAASAATITFNPTGLFDIVVSSGSRDPNGVVVDGGRIERNVAASGGEHHAYLVSVPANNAMTMLVQGGASLGFDIAGSASVEGNTVVLSAGRNLFGGRPVGPPNRLANATIDHASIGSSLLMDASGAALIGSTSGATMLAGNAEIIAGKAITITADQLALGIAGSLTATAQKIGNDAVGGTITLAAQHGQALTIGGSVALAADGFGFAAVAPGTNAGNGTGGTVKVEARSGGTVAIAGSLEAHANGGGGSSGYSNGAAGSGTGGTVMVNAADGNSLVHVAGVTSLGANGRGGGPNSCGTCAITPGSGHGGTVIVSGAGAGAGTLANRLAFDRGLSLAANGDGGNADLGGGAGTGGTAQLLASDATIIDILGGLAIGADGRGGRLIGTATGAAGAGSGGLAQIATDGLAGGAIHVASGGGAIVVTAQGRGGDAPDGAGTGGEGHGGAVVIDAKGAAVALSVDAMLDATGQGGGSAAGSGGHGTGGGVLVAARGGGSLGLAAALAADASGTGGTAPATGARGGDGSGGSVILEASGSGSTSTVGGTATLNGEGRGASGGVGGPGSGGQVVASIGGGPGNRIGIGGGLAMRATGVGGAGSSGAGGDGHGGGVHLRIGDDGRLTLGGGLWLAARGAGGAQDNGGIAGQGTGGEAEISLAAGGAPALIVGGAADAADRTTLLDSSGTGGASGGSGGAGSGGGSRIAGVSGRATFGGDVVLLAAGTGGTGASGSGGAATGGRARLTSTGAAFHLSGGLTLATDAAGGTGRDGGAAAMGASGGDPDAAILVSNGGSVTVAGAVALRASTTGGAGTNGGTGGKAGAAQVALHAEGGSLTGGAVSIAANSSGGAGSATSVGGDAVSSGLSFVAHQASVDLGAVGASLVATGGAGAPPGRAIERGNILFDVAGGAVHLAGFDAVSRAGAAVDPGALPDALRVVGANVTVDGGFSLATDRALSVHLDSARLGAASVALHAADFIDDASVGAPATMGTLAADRFDIVTGHDLMLDANLVSLGSLSLTAPGLGRLGSIAATGAGSEISLVAGTTFDTPSIGASGAVDVRGGGQVTLGTVSGRGVRVRSSGGSIRADDIAAPLGVADLGAAGDVLAGGVSGDQVAIAAGRDVVTGGISAAVGGIDVRAGRTIAAQAIGAAGDVTLAAGGAITTRAIGSRAGGINASAATDLVTADLAAGRALILDAGGSITSGSIGAQSGALTALGNITIGAATVRDAFDARSDGSLTAAGIGAGDRIRLASGAGLLAADLSAGLRGIDLKSGTTLSVGTLAAGSDINLDAAGLLTSAAITSRAGGIRSTGGGNIVTGALSASGAVSFNARGSISSGPITARSIGLFAVGDIAVGDAATSEGVDVETDGALTAGKVVAGEHVDLAARGTIRAGDISAGLITGPVRSGATYHAAAVAGTSLTLGNVAARDWVGLGARASLDAGAIDARGDLLLTADGPIRTGPLASGAQARTLIGGADLLALGQGGPALDPARLFAALGTSAQAATKGPVTIGGAIMTGRLDALVGTDFSTGALTATIAAVAAVGGTMTISGAWSAPLTHIASNDIAITSGGGIGGARIELVSTNPSQLLVGDGLGGAGYALSDAEFGRLSAGSILISGRSDAGAAIDTLVGSLTLTGRSGGSSVMIASGGANRPAGVLRVVGAVRGTGLGARDELTLAAGRIEVDAVKGGVSLEGASGTPGGVLTFAGQRIHVAEAAILDKLAADPAYTDRDLQLAKAPATARPDGVLRAADIVVNLINPGGQAASAGATSYSVLVQNLGSEVIPAGFAAARVEIVSPIGAGAGVIDLNVNGQLVTDKGNLVGADVRDALMKNDDPGRFTTLSLINGCALTGPCVLRQTLPIDPHPSISTEIQLLGLTDHSKTPFGNEDEIADDDSDASSASSPITPPMPLFNTRALDPKGETDEPVSGGGNPALTGSRPAQGGK